MKLRILLTSFLLFSSSVSAQWTSEVRTDAMTDEVLATARVINGAGHEFAVFRVGSPGEPVLARFAIAEDSLGQISPGHPLMYRIDDHEPINLENVMFLAEKASELGLDDDPEKYYEWQPKWVNFGVWHGQGDLTRSTALEQIVNGETLLVRYNLPTGGFKDTKFSLEDSRAALRDIFGGSDGD